MISWLIDQVERIWKRISSVVSLAYNWARDKAQNALDRARSYAYNLYKSATRFASDLVNSARAYASSLAAGVKALARNWAAQAKSFASSILKTAEKYFYRAIDRARAFASDLAAAARDRAHELAKGALKSAIRLIDELRALAKGLVKAARSEAVQLHQEAQSALEELRIKIGAGDADSQATLVSLATSPAATIAAFLQTFLLDLLFWLLAKGFGRRGLDVGPPPRIPSGHRGDGGSTGGDGGRTQFGDPPSSVRAAIEEHFPSDAVDDAIAISYLESGWNAAAVNDSRGRAGGRCNERYTLPDGRSALTEYSVGLFQINICAHGGSYEQWADPYRNAAKAASLFRASGWAPWRYSAQALGLL